MREVIQAENPGMYCLPGESELRAEISALFAKEKEQKMGKAKRTTKQPQIPEGYRDKIVQILESADWNLAPNNVLAMLEAAQKARNGGHLPRDYPASADLSRTVSSLKSGHKSRIETARKRSLIG